MSLMRYFKSSKTNTASIAKERLQILIAHEHSSQRKQPSYLPALKEELLAVVQKYINIDSDDISMNFEQDNNQEVLELNILLPEDSGKEKS